MKKLLFISVLLISCGEPYVSNPEKASVQKTFATNGGNRYTIITIDSCEYIQYDIYGGAAIVHKGNCKNPIHIKNIGYENNPAQSDDSLIEHHFVIKDINGNGVKFHCNSKR